MDSFEPLGLWLLVADIRKRERKIAFDRGFYSRAVVQDFTVVRMKSVDDWPNPKKKYDGDIFKQINHLPPCADSRVGIWQPDEDGHNNGYRAWVIMNDLKPVIWGDHEPAISKLFPIFF